MKVTVQYNDFIGTAAADISDHTDLNKFLASRGIDTDRYEAIGASFYYGYSDFFSASIICIDRQQSTKSNKFITKISFEDEFDREEFFDLFKRFNVVISTKHGNYSELEVKEEITFDDRTPNEE
jgi:hypothetical protein